MTCHFLFESFLFGTLNFKRRGVLRCISPSIFTDRYLFHLFCHLFSSILYISSPACFTSLFTLFFIPFLPTVQLHFLPLLLLHSSTLFLTPHVVYFIPALVSCQSLLFFFQRVPSIHILSSCLTSVFLWSFPSFLCLFLCLPSFLISLLSPSLSSLSTPSFHSACFSPSLVPPSCCIPSEQDTVFCN